MFLDRRLIRRDVGAVPLLLCNLLQPVQSLLWSFAAKSPVIHEEENATNAESGYPSH